MNFLDKNIDYFNNPKKNDEIVEKQNDEMAERQND